MTRLLPLACLFFLLFAGCSAGDAPAPASSASTDIPAWSHDVVWYQIFVERFRNGDPANDPTLADMKGSWPNAQPEGWKPTPWGQDWYQQEPWAEATGADFYFTAQLRRYGGDLQGVIDQLDYLDDLGVTALYLNPVNDSPSLHKYDARNYRHVDRNFGPDPAGDAAIMASEDPVNPETWQWTSADSLLLALIQDAHDRDMRIILDYSWNHTGVTFWAWQDVLRNGQDSPYSDWYDIERFDDPATPDENEFSYRGWAGVRELPELRKVGRPADFTHGASEGTLTDDVRNHVFAVSRRWLDPNGDGDPSDGIDGFRLDVAEIVPLGFWREYRDYVRSINPEAYLVGEIWWEQWPDRMYDPKPWLAGDVFDAVMNYRWYYPSRSFFAATPPYLTASQYVAHLDSIETGIHAEIRKAMMNLTASHDSPRFGTSIYNPGRYKDEPHPRGTPDYRIDRPDGRTREIQEMILVQQFTYPGSPHIFYGDEVGMWGADDPDLRKPMVWDDIDYEDETTHPFGLPRKTDQVEPDAALQSVYRGLIALRKAHLRLFADGALEYVTVNDHTRVLAYTRSLGGERALVAFNASDREQPFELPPGDWNALRGGAATSTLPPRSAHVWMEN